MDYYKNLSPKTLDGERWEYIDGYPGYFVSDLGRIKNSDGKILVQSFCREYLTLGLTRSIKNKVGRRLGKERKTVRVHRIVAICFVKNPDPKTLITVNHNNGIKTDNTKGNLKWMTVMDNKRHGYKMGHNKYKTTPKMVKRVRLLKREGVMQKDIAIIMNMCESGVSDILTGRHWSYID